MEILFGILIVLTGVVIVAAPLINAAARSIGGHDDE